MMSRFRSPGTEVFGLVLAGSLGVALCLPQARAGAQAKWRPGTFMTQALSRVMAGARQLTEKTEYGLDDGSLCFGGAYLKPGQSAGTTVPLEGGRTYALIGGGDEDAQDVDVQFLTPNGKVAAQDVEDDADPVATFTPPANGQYRMVLKLETSKSGDSFCAFTLLRKGGWDVPVTDLTTAARNTLLVCEAIHEQSNGASFHAGDGEWGLIGTILKKGETLTHRGIRMGKGNHAVVAAGDGDVQDLDLAVVQADGQVIGKDEDDDPNPVVVFDTPGSVGFQLKSVEAKGPAVCFAAILEIK